MLKQKKKMWGEKVSRVRRLKRFLIAPRKAPKTKRMRGRACAVRHTQTVLRSELHRHVQPPSTSSFSSNKTSQARHQTYFVSTREEVLFNNGGVASRGWVGTPRGLGAR